MLKTLASAKDKVTQCSRGNFDAMMVRSTSLCHISSSRQLQYLARTVMHG